MNEIYQTIQNMDLFNIGNAFSELDKSGHVLTETEIIILAVTAAAGLLLCLLGLKIVRFWGAVLGLAFGFIIGTPAALAAGVDVGIIAGAVVGIILALLSSILYKMAIFVTVFITASLFSAHLINPQNGILLGICLAIELVAAVLSVKFAAVLTILATACCGAVIAGPAVYYLLPDTGMDVLVRILLCTLFGAGGVLVQLLLESKKRKKQSLKKAEEIRNEISTENEVERARAAMNDLESTTEAESEIDGESSEKN